MNILITTILRNRSTFIRRWLMQLNDLISIMPQHTFHLSVYENDSVDNSPMLLKNANYSKFVGDIKITTSNIGTGYYSRQDPEHWKIHGSSEDRLRNLAQARNAAIDQFKRLDSMDIIIAVEPDITYVPKIIAEFVEKSRDYDIISPRSLEGNSNLQYDNFATRATDEENWWSLDKTHVSNGPIPVWSTFNCFCVYSAQPIIDGIRYHWINPRWNKPDCDTSVICENFRASGHNRIYMDTDYIVRHFG